MRIEPSADTVRILESSGVAGRIREVLADPKRLECLTRILELEGRPSEPMGEEWKRYGYEVGSDGRRTPTPIFSDEALDEVLRRVLHTRFRSRRRGVGGDPVAEGNYLQRVTDTGMITGVVLGAEAAYNMPAGVEFSEDRLFGCGPEERDPGREARRRREGGLNCWHNAVLGYALAVKFELEHPGCKSFFVDEIRYVLLPNGTKVLIDRLDMSGSGFWHNFAEPPTPTNTHVSEWFRVELYDEVTRSKRRRDGKPKTSSVYKNKGMIRSLELPLRRNGVDTAEYRRSMLGLGLTFFQNHAGYSFLDDIKKERPSLEEAVLALP